MNDSRPERTSESLSISVPHGRLEALWEQPGGDLLGGAVLCHPHPQYGGSMHTKAMYHLARALNERGIGTLRFNFRGVGASSGAFDDGEGEKDDVRSALDTLRERVTDRPLLLAGFSFGSVVGLDVARDEPDLKGLIGIGLPVRLADLTFLREDNRPLLVLQGENDQFGSPEEVRDVVDVQRDNVTFTVIEGTGHLFEDRFERLREEIEGFFQSGPGRLIFE